MGRPMKDGPARKERAKTIAFLLSFVNNKRKAKLLSPTEHDIEAGPDGIVRAVLREMAARLVPLGGGAPQREFWTCLDVDFRLAAWKRETKK